MNSLAIKLLAIFVLVFSGTVLVSFGLGLSVARRSVEAEIRSRTNELASATVSSLKRVTPDDESISEELASVLRMNRDLLTAELGRGAALGIDTEFHSAHTEPDGIYINRWRGPLLAITGPQTSAVTEVEGHGRS
ncbi:MAG: hypothetical protein JST92_20575, partial [Deltaproteobacteria bacterium]|nr:hypothetical protein [Deltaproteobacteria bacterium]